MKLATAVIGAGYGDEGKGLMTDFFCHQSIHAQPLVVRFNGGAQAGHTVVTPSKSRHVFSHLGSGSFLKCPTYLASEFIVNPILYNKERKFFFKSIVYVHPDARVTTPYDMLLNQVIEDSRINRHGSCGIGIFETILRHNEIPLCVRDLVDISTNINKLHAILGEIKGYVYNRLNQCGVVITNEIEELIELHFVEQFHRDVDLFINDIIIMDDPRNLSDMFIFEGAQGLLLNEKYNSGVHLTPSDTGIYTPLMMCDAMGVDYLNVCYVTRCYTTRHGAGPLSNESTLEQMRLNVYNETNVSNMYQGDFRYAPLDEDNISRAIRQDLLQNSNFNVNTSAQLAITCVDQLPSDCDKVHLLSYIKSELNLQTGYYSVGPTRAHVKKLSNKVEL